MATTYRHYDLDQATRKELSISSYGGVDYSNQKFNVSTNRAIDEINYVYKDGVVQKREGYTEIALVPTIKYIAYPLDGDTVDKTILTNSESKTFNGVWTFLAGDGKYHTIAHIGKLLFEISNIEGKQVSFTLLSSTPSAKGTDSLSYATTYEHLDSKSMAFVGNKCLWFLGGVKYMRIGFKTDGTLIYEKVEEGSTTYVPTTTTSITCVNSIISQRASFDYANIMTMWRKNTCLSGTEKDEEGLTQTKYYEYILDAPIKLKDSESDVSRLENSKVISSISEETQKQLAKIKIRIEKIVIETEE